MYEYSIYVVYVSCMYKFSIVHVCSMYMQDVCNSIMQYVYMLHQCM